METVLEELKKLTEEVDRLNEVTRIQQLWIGKIRASLNLGGAYDNIFTLMNTLEEQKRLTNEVLYKHLQEHKSVARYGFSPMVSIIMPVYFEIKDDADRHRQYLTQSIKSIMDQTYRPLEGIIVNDGCGEPETKLLEEVLEHTGSMIRYYRKENGGTSSALNYGIERMNGTYFAWLSHDDYYYPNHIETHIAHLCKTPVEEKIITTSLVEIVDENSNYILDSTLFDSIYGKDYKRSVLKRERSFNVYTIGGCSVVIPKDAFQRHGGFDLNSSATHEYELWRRIESEYHFFTIPLFTHSYRIHGNSEHARISDLGSIVMNEKIRIIKDVSEAEYKELYGSEANFLHVLKTLYYVNCNEHMLVQNELNQRLRELGYDS